MTFPPVLQTEATFTQLHATSSNPCRLMEQKSHLTWFFSQRCFCRAADAQGPPPIEAEQAQATPTAMPVGMPKPLEQTMASGSSLALAHVAKQGMVS